MHRQWMVMAGVLTVIVAIGLFISGPIGVTTQVATRAPEERGGQPEGVTDGVTTQEVTPERRQRGGQREGVSMRTMASGSLEVLAPGTAFMGLGSISLEPGTAIPFDPTDPSAVLIYLASGELTFQVEAPMEIARRGATGTPAPTEPVEIEANTAFTMRQGDSALFPPALAGEVRNEGTKTASAWLVNVAVVSDVAATPTP